MNSTKLLTSAVIIIILGVIGWYAFSPKAQQPVDDHMDTVMNDQTADSMMKDDKMMDEGETMMKAGSYEAYAPEKLALASNGKVVLFFRASWCPTCRGLDADIRSNLGKIPENVTILDVNYDTATALKQKYGVTYQHTLVQVDASGNQITKWSSSPTLAALVSQIK